MKTIYLLLLSSFITVFSKAQVSVTATSGTLGPTNYPTLKAAFDAVNDGTHKGYIEVSITANLIETATAVLNESGGPSDYVRIMIESISGDKTITGNIDGPLIELNGAD